jgi:hypothetical protein
MLLSGVEQTAWTAQVSLESSPSGRASESQRADLCIDSLGLYEEEREAPRKAIRSAADIDPVVQYMIRAT